MIHILSSIGALLQFSDRNIFIQNCCCEILEKCWNRNLPGKEVAAVNVPPYLLARALCPIGKADDISRLNMVKDMLALIDFQCISSASLISLLCKAASDDLFLRNKQVIFRFQYTNLLSFNLWSFFLIYFKSDFWMMENRFRYEILHLMLFSGSWISKLHSHTWLRSYDDGEQGYQVHDTRPERHSSFKSWRSVLWGDRTCKKSWLFATLWERMYSGTYSVCITLSESQSKQSCPECC